MSHKKHLCCLSILVASCWGQSTHAQTNDPLDPLRKPCNSQELAALKNAVDVARSLATKASAELPARNSTQGAKFKRWFGGPDGDDDPIIKAVYDEMPLMLAFKKFWCLPPNSTTPAQFFHTDAFVSKKNDWEIFVTSRFFRLPTTGVGTQGGTIVHEVAHQSSHRNIIDDDINGDGKNDYGPKNAALRANKSMSKARYNSDNFKYFAEDVVFGVPP